MTKIARIIGLTMLLSLVAIVAACGGGAATSPDIQEFATKKVGDKLNISISNAKGKLQNGQQDLMLNFTDAAGKPVDITAATLNFNMPAMGTMAEMNDPATLSTTGTAGQFKGKVNIEMAGEWIAQISYEGAETGKTTINTTAQ